jgi:hypothetical protein
VRAADGRTRSATRAAIPEFETTPQTNSHLALSPNEKSKSHQSVAMQRSTSTN